MSNSKRVTAPSSLKDILVEIVKVGQKVHVTVTEIDLKRNRISLSMKAQPELDGQPKERRDSANRRDSPAPRNQRNQRGPSSNRNPGQKPPSSDDWFSIALKNAKKK